MQLEVSPKVLRYKFFKLGKEEIQFDAKMMNDVVLGENFFDVELAGEFLRGATRTPFQPEPITVGFKK